MDYLQDIDYYSLLSYLPGLPGQIHRTLNSLIASLSSSSQDSQTPSLYTIALLLLVLVLSLHLLNMLLRTVLFWLRLVFKLAFWGALVLFGTWIYVRGLDGATDDARYWVEYWQGEMQRYEGQARAVKGWADAAGREFGHNAERKANQARKRGGW